MDFGHELPRRVAQLKALFGWRKDRRDHWDAQIDWKSPGELEVCRLVLGMRLAKRLGAAANMAEMWPSLSKAMVLDWQLVQRNLAC